MFRLELKITLPGIRYRRVEFSRIHVKIHTMYKIHVHITIQCTKFSRRIGTYFDWCRQLATGAGASARAGVGAGGGDGAHYCEVL